MAGVTVLEVVLYDKPIGTLTHLQGGRVYFSFTQEYIEDVDRPVLSLGFKNTYGELITEFGSKQTRLQPYFSNLLPEGHMREYLAKRAGVNPDREFFLLYALGKDLSGAVTIRATAGEDWLPDLSEPDGNRDDNDQVEYALRFSLAGVQIKFSAINDAHGGLTIPAHGMGGDWIIKLPSTRYQGVPENEFSMMTLARLVGIDVPVIKLVDVGDIANLPVGIDGIGGQAFGIERFDRLEGETKVHFEDFAQVFGVYPEKKYGSASVRNIVNVIAAECEENEIVEFIRRLTFNTLIGNADMHLKNWSLIYHDRNKAWLAPAYDFVSTIAYIEDKEAALKFSRTKRFDQFSYDELSHLAANAKISEKLVLETARQTVEVFHEHWHKEKSQLPLAESVIGAIERHLKTVPIA